MMMVRGFPTIFRYFLLFIERTEPLTDNNGVGVFAQKLKQEALVCLYFKERIYMLTVTVTVFGINRGM